MNPQRIREVREPAQGHRAQLAFDWDCGKAHRGEADLEGHQCESACCIPALPLPGCESGHLFCCFSFIYHLQFPPSPSASGCGLDPGNIINGLRFKEPPDYEEVRKTSHEHRVAGARTEETPGYGGHQPRGTDRGQGRADTEAGQRRAPA